MLRCIEISRNGIGFTAPNPMVGCVIVHNDVIIGEGWHRKFGGPHAEVNAMANTGLQMLPKAATVYVSLEPCAHYGKTPPCADMLIDCGARRVVIGALDPFPSVNGNGIKRLQEVGVEVISGVLEKDCVQNDPSFFYSIREQKPWITLKWAQSADGFVAPLNHDKRASYRLTSETTDVLTHTWRSQHQAILVGSGTAVSDNPSLTVRHVHGNNPIRILIDSTGKVPHTSKLFDGTVETWVFGKCAAQGVEVFRAERDDILQQIFRTCAKRNVRSLFIEGGPTLLQLFIDAGYWNVAQRIKTPELLEQGVAAPSITANKSRISQSGPDLITTFYND